MAYPISSLDVILIRPSNKLVKNSLYLTAYDISLYVMDNIYLNFFSIELFSHQCVILSKKEVKLLRNSSLHPTLI